MLTRLITILNNYTLTKRYSTTRLRLFFVFFLLFLSPLFVSSTLYSYELAEEPSFPHFFKDQDITTQLQIPNIFVVMSLNEDFELSEAKTNEIVGDALFFPNPFRLSVGSELGFYLSKNMDTEIRIYNMRAQEVFRQSYSAGSNGGMGQDFGYNRVSFNSTHFNYDLSSGVYIFLIIYNDTILQKGKFFLLP